VELPQELFIISDLHLGGEYGKEGERGFRINTHVEELVAFLEEVQARAAAGPRCTELIVNGDFVDFLAERDQDGRWHAFIEEEGEAVKTFDRIAQRDSAVFDQLATMLQKGVGLTFTLGNHDLELSLPAVRDRLKEKLHADRTSPFQFVYDGEAYVFDDVLVEHGNRYDGWNVIDFDRLRRYRSECSRRLDPSPDALFEAPAGSMLVEEVMNPIKADYGFIDLLKPENDAAVPLLLALEPAYAKDIDRLERVHQLRKDSEWRRPAAAARPSRPENIRRAESQRVGGRLADLLKRRLDPESAQRFIELADDAEQQSRAQKEQIAAGKLRQVASFTRMLFTREWEGRRPWLFDAFRQLQTAKLFDWSEETVAEYREAAEELASGGFSVVAFGHTHQPKEVALPGGSKYLNTGTWADFMRVPDEIIAGREDQAMTRLNEFAEAVRRNQFNAWVEFLPTFGHICLAGGKVKNAVVRKYEAGVVATL